MDFLATNCQPGSQIELNIGNTLEKKENLWLYQKNLDSTDQVHAGGDCVGQVEQNSHSRTEFGAKITEINKLDEFWDHFHTGTNFAEYKILNSIFHV